jgi:superoxide reductase
MKGFVCDHCGYVSINGSAPKVCPVCFTTAFKENDNALKTASDEADKAEKHSPVIVVNKQCGLIPEGCIDVHVKVGSVLHPMEKEHYITWIDFYLDNEFISRVSLTPEKVNPGAGLHLKVSTGKITAVEHCNMHGSWISEKEL